MLAMSASPLTPLDYLATGYWQDFLASRPIAGGIAYEVELHNCQLDESLISLQRVDTLLSQIRRDITKSNIGSETTLLADERYRNLLVFLGFYAGRVLARQWQNTPHWYSQFELGNHYPELPLIANDFYQYMAVLYNGISDPTTVDDIKDSPNQGVNTANGINHKDKWPALVFFALEPIGLRLFGHIDRQFEAVQGGQVANGLYQAVSERLPNTIIDRTATESKPTTELNPRSAITLSPTQPEIITQIKRDEFSPVTDSKAASYIANITIDKTASDTVLKTDRKVIAKTDIKSGIAATDTVLNKPADNTVKPIISLKDNISTTMPVTDTGLPANETKTKDVKGGGVKGNEIEASRIQDKEIEGNETQTEDILSEPLSSSKPTALNTSSSPTPEIFTQLLTELDDIEMAQTAGEDDYQRACKTLDQFERHISKQNKPRAQVVFSESHQVAKQQALIVLKNAATLGNTAAMLRLGMYELLGEGLPIDNPVNTDVSKDKSTGNAVGAEWIEQAANNKDIRAQRLLSKIYYQGVGVPQDLSQGKYWLEQAAENGHAEAASVVEQWQQAQALITTHQQEQHSIKRYQLLIGGVLIFALLLFIFV